MAALRHQGIALVGVVERNAYLVKRYGWSELAFFAWTVANTLTIVFIAEGVRAAGGHLDVNRQTTILLIGAVLWAYPIRLRLGFHPRRKASARAKCRPRGL